ncbi:MAG: translation initiation factor IF-2 [Planctomycetota bacterium]|nr:translation initiation factor IF-2 [Planctomycetota bacterium]MDP6762392.1 translation initiation factor IF-2 [Planctomycetota bacterium]
MAKKRIHELAKEYGLTGKDLAAKLRDRGFSQVKSHMTAIDDIELLQIQGVLEAHGIVPITSGDDETVESLGGGLILRKKKKRKAPPAEAADEPAPEEARQPEVPAEEEVTAMEAAAPVDVPATEPAVEAEPEQEQEPELEAESATEPEAVEAAGAPGGAAEEGAGPSTSAESVQPEVDDEAPAEEPAEEEAVPEAPEPAATTKTREPAGPQGKVVGFIDLSKVKTTQPRRSESRRLDSSDEFMPDVRPTLRHDPRRAMMRGDRGSRDSLSAAQLREREAGRYLRRGRGGPGAAERRPKSRRDGPSGSPFSGSTVKIETPITLKKLAEALAVKSNQLMQIAFRQLGFGSVKSQNEVIEEDTAVLLAGELDVELDIIHEVEAEETLIEGLKKKRSEVGEEHLAERSPTLAFLGHVDHGKTTLIDAIRQSQVADGEDGGITQHIGAYQVTTDAGHSLTVIDTPGHAAFTGMRARGARAVDVVVLVVAADAGVQPQTEEAVAHARAASTPIVVAMTKVDRAEANPQRVLQQLGGLELHPEAYGGETGVVEVSGITGQGIQELLERVVLESEILELQCHPESPAVGVVLEAEVQQGKGIVAQLLVQDGTLSRGDVILAGEGYGKVRSMHDDRDELLEQAGPSTPVECSGLSALPGIGEPFHVVDKLEEAKEVAEERSRKSRAATMAERRRADTEGLLQQVTSGNKRELVNIIIRADVQGSAEVLRQAVGDLAHEEVEARVLQVGVGAVNENDILLASTSEALVVAFRVGVNAEARKTADRENIEIKNFGVLYDVLDHVRGLMEGSLAPEVREEITGHAEIRRVFRSSKFGNIAGCFVLDGTIARDQRVRLLRDGTVVHAGRLASIRREKDDAREVREGFECGLLLRGYNDIRENDVIEAFKEIEIKRTLSSPTVG